MCRVLAFLGKPTVLDDLLFHPDNSLVRQTTDPKHLEMLSLGGFGMLAWAPGVVRPERPVTYRTTQLPAFDPNLRSLASSLAATCLLAHVRGIADDPAAYGSHNLHPFHYPGYRYALAHNGDLSGFSRMRQRIMRRIRPEVAAQIAGTTDSEYVYALLMSQLEDPTQNLSPLELMPALFRTIEILREEREAAGIRRSSSLNLFLTSGEGMVGLRFTFDFGCYGTDDPESVHEANLRFLSLWYTIGERYEHADGAFRMVSDGAGDGSVLLASEPLTSDVSGWVEVPEYSALCVSRTPGGVRVDHVPVDL